jgi:hypothetical protein
MIALELARRSFGICVVSAMAFGLLEACSQNSGGVLLLSTNAPLSGALPQAVPPCKGQKTTKEYAYITETFSTEGGDLCDPVFGGFGGTLPYAPAKPSVKIKLTTSTTNYNNKLPKLGKGTPLVYEQLMFGEATTFGKNATGDAVFFGVKIDPGKPYTLFAQFIVKGKKMNANPCYAMASKGKYGGVFNDGASPLMDTAISADTTIIGEVNPGKQTNTKCS